MRRVSNKDLNYVLLIPLDQLSLSMGYGAS